MRVCVIGGGASGMISAITSAQNGAEVILIEKNKKLGKKLYITGKGRCNLTNNVPVDEFCENIISNKKFLYGALRKFDSATCIDFFENLGLSLKTERGNRVFPTSDKSSDVIKVLEKKLVSCGVKIYLDETVIDLITDENQIIAVITNKNSYPVDKVIVCTGGISYPATGSTGDGYVFAKKLGHSLIPPKPALCGLITDCVNNAVHQKIQLKNLPKIQGLSLKNVTAYIKNIDNNLTILEEFGEMLFTENGVSGPIILTLSSKINRLDFAKFCLIIDLKPALSESKLDERLLRDFSENKNKMLKNSLGDLLPSSIIPFIIKLSGISPDKPINSVSKEERKRIVSLIKGLTFSITSLENISSAIITAGGINVKEIDPKTMRSKLVNNLYFAGEIIDVDALTGGFNLQIAFSTGYVAGKLQ